MCPTVVSPAGPPALDWAAVAARFPARPPADLDTVLDATGICIERHGLRRTTMTDIAREAGIARSTLYQKVASVEHAVVGYATRELHRFFDDQREADDVTSARGVVRSMAQLVRWVWDQPAYARLRDETDLLAGLFSSRDALLDVMTIMMTPPLALLVDAGIVRPHDPALLAGWIARTLVMVTLAPPPGDLEDALVAMLLPALEPAAASS
jgi:AcrR family transcriptional regulator